MVGCDTLSKTQKQNKHTEHQNMIRFNQEYSLLTLIQLLKDFEQHDNLERLIVVAILPKEHTGYLDILTTVVVVRNMVSATNMYSDMIIQHNGYIQKIGTLGDIKRFIPLEGDTHKKIKRTIDIINMEDEYIEF